MSTTTTTQAVTVSALNALMLELVRKDDRDLSLRQLAVLGQLTDAASPLTVRGLAAELNVSKPAITRAMDRLNLAGLAKRAADPKDKRSVLLKPTPKGRELARLAERTIRDALAQAAA